MTNPVLTAAAVLPALYLLYCIYQADRVEKEPAGLLISLAISGIIATFLAMMAESVGYLLVSSVFWEGSILYNFFFYFFVVALSEEGFKYLLLKKRTWNSPAFNCRFDGVVYAVFVSLGFAAIENLLYVFQYGLSVAWARGVLAVPAHMGFAVYMGAFYGRAKICDVAGDHQGMVTNLVLSYAVPVLFHALYDATAMVNTSTSTMLFVVFVAVMYVIVYKRIKSESYRDTEIY
jgi:RsiW-degrading membrane proteinase PrsW (M82 family)